MSGRETIEQKAGRYLAEGRLTLGSLSGRRVRAICSGGADYELGHEPGDGWFCDCPAHKTCAHLRALQLVIVPRGDRRG